MADAGANGDPTWAARIWLWVSGRQPDWWMAVATVILAGATLVVALVQRHASARVFRIALITLLLEHRARMTGEGQVTAQDAAAWLSTMSALLRRWANRETDAIQEELQRQLRKIP